VRNGARRAAVALLALALLVPATAHAAIPTDPEFTVGGQMPPWAKAINWEPSDPNVALTIAYSLASSASMPKA